MTTMTALELKEVREALRARLTTLDRVRTTCDDCVSLNGSGLCSTFNEVPPPEFRSKPGACAEWRFDGVPF